MSDHLLVFDAHDLLKKACESTPADRFSPSGELVHGVYAAARWLHWSLGPKATQYVAIVTETGSSSQALLISQLVEALGFCRVVAPQGRSTNVAAALVSLGTDAGVRVSVVGSDKRLAALVGPGVWWCDPYKRVRYNPSSVSKRFGVPPEHVADWIALVGDDSTPVAGVKGIGAKGATDLLLAHGGLSAVLEQHTYPDPEKPALPKRVTKALNSQMAEALVGQRLAHLDVESGLEQLPGLEDLRPSESLIDNRNEAYAALGFYELLAATEGAVTGPPCVVVPEGDDISPDDTLFCDPGTPAIAVLFDGPSAIRGRFAGLAVTTPNSRRFFRSLPPNLRRWLSSGAPKVGHDTKVAAVVLATQGCPLGGIVGDSILASHLLDPSGSAPHELPALTRSVLHRPLAVAEDVLGTGRRTLWSDLDDSRAAEYATQSADAASGLWDRLSPRTSSSLLDESLRLSNVLVTMEHTGMRVSDESLATAGEDFSAMAQELSQQIYDMAGRSFNLASSKQLGQVLFGDLELPVLARTKTGWSTATHVLERLTGEHPIVAPVIRHRRLQRLQTNWVTSLRAAIGFDGRIHTTFHPARSFSGRLVNSHPDLGRVPGRTPEMNRIRRAFVVADGHTMLSVDYEQLGLYVLAHLTEDPALVTPLLAGADMHVETAAAVLDRPAAQIDREARQVGKVVNFATFAGQGASALRQQLGVSVEEAKTMIARFDERYAVTRRYQEAQLEHCRQHGFIETLVGRPWPIRDVHSNDLHMRAYGERLARRAPHEGSVADVTRRGLLRAAEALQDSGLGARPLLQIHDEVLFEVPLDELEGTIALTGAAMSDAFQLLVPLRVGCKVGPNWADLVPVQRP